MNIAYVVYHGQDAEVDSPYDRILVDRLKGSIPPSFRHWQPERKRWLIEGPYIDVILRLLRERFDEVIEFNKPKPFTSPGNPSRCACKTEPDCVRLFVLPDAPLPVITAAYRALSKELHPDHGGSTEAMQQLNAAFERLKARQAVTHGR